jgi:hypothetical protein
LTSGKAKTFYITSSAEKNWDRYLELCKSKLNLSASKRINSLWLQDLFSLEGRENSAISHNLEEMIAQKQCIERKENSIKDFLSKDKISNCATLFDALVNLAERLGAGPGLKNNLPLIRQKLIEYQITPQDPFSKGDRQAFVIYLDYVLKRRNLEGAIDHFLLCHNGTTQANEIPIIDQEANPS